MMEQHDYLQINVNTVHSSLFFDVFRAGRARAESRRSGWTVCSSQWSSVQDRTGSFPPAAYPTSPRRPRPDTSQQAECMPWRAGQGPMSLAAWHCTMCRIAGGTCLAHSASKHNGPYWFLPTQKEFTQLEAAVCGQCRLSYEQWCSVANKGYTLMCSGVV